MRDAIHARASVAPRAGERLARVDWLKVVVAIGVCAYHAAQPFVLTTWIVVDRESSVVLSGLAAIGYLFVMPLMFLLAGGTSWLALRSTTTVRYLGRRLRLAIPLVIGIAVLGPVQGWIGALTRGETRSLPDYALAYWADAELAFTPMWLGTYGHHLWFIGFLLVYSIVGVPLLSRIGAMEPAAATGRGWAFVAPLSVLVVGQLALRFAFPAYRDWADFVLWFAYYAIGAALVAHGSLLQAVTGHGAVQLFAAALLTGVLAALFAMGGGLDLEAGPRPDPVGVTYVALRTAVGWCWVAGALALGARWLDRRRDEAATLSRLVLPFYVLHHPLVVVAAAAVVPTALPWPAKFALITGASLVLSAGGAAIVVRTPALRLLFGMAPPRPAVRLAPASA